MLTERQAETLRLLSVRDNSAQCIGQQLASLGLVRRARNLVLPAQSILASLERRKLVCSTVSGSGAYQRWEWAILADGFKALREYDSCAT